MEKAKGDRNGYNVKVSIIIFVFNGNDWNVSVVFSDDILSAHLANFIYAAIALMQ